jgi:hypothetical protein
MRGHAGSIGGGEQNHIASIEHGPPGQFVQLQRVPSAYWHTTGDGEHTPVGGVAGHMPRPLQSTAVTLHTWPVHIARSRQWNEGSSP